MDWLMLLIPIGLTITLLWAMWRLVVKPSLPFLYEDLDEDDEYEDF